MSDRTLARLSGAYVSLAIGSKSSDDDVNSLIAVGSGSAAFWRENERLDELSERGDDWDGRGSEGPSDETIEFARRLIPIFNREAINTGRGWTSPHLTTSEVGEIVFEWWSGSKKLTIYVAKATIEFIKIWGPNIDTEMEEGRLAYSSDIAYLWNWLNV